MRQVEAELKPQEIPERVRKTLSVGDMGKSRLQRQIAQFGELTSQCFYSCDSFKFRDELTADLTSSPPLQDISHPKEPVIVTTPVE